MTLTAAAAVALLALRYLIRRRANTTWHRLIFFFVLRPRHNLHQAAPSTTDGEKPLRRLSVHVCRLFSVSAMRCDAMR
uniref:Putative secreted protein n=1 Tax=Anopheles darlingi TaxID=43151 RepID=A0A2M4D5C6_ANODA